MSKKLEALVERYIGAPYFGAGGEAGEGQAYATQVQVNGFNVPCRVQEVRVYEEEIDWEQGARERVHMKILVGGDGLILDFEVEAWITLSERTVDYCEPDPDERQAVQDFMDARTFAHLNFE